MTFSCQYSHSMYFELRDVEGYAIVPECIWQSTPLVHPHTFAHKCVVLAEILFAVGCQERLHCTSLLHCSGGVKAVFLVDLHFSSGWK